jgi:hypothetical protein
MLLFGYHPVQESDTLDIRLTLQLSPDEQNSVLSARSPEAYFTKLLGHDASLLPRNYVLTRCEAAPHGDRALLMWKVLASARRRASAARGN